MRVRLTFADGDNAEYEAEVVEVQTIDPVQINAAEHGFSVVLTEVK